MKYVQLCVVGKIIMALDSGERLLVGITSDSQIREQKGVGLQELSKLHMGWNPGSMERNWSWMGVLL